MGTLPAVAAVVVNWNLPDLTLECIDSLRASAYPGLQIIVVDNGSTPDCLRLLQRGAADCTLLPQPVNRGFAAASNVGIRYALAAGAQYILLINNDAVAAPDMLHRLVAESESSRRPGIVAPLILYDGMRERVWRFGDCERSWLPVPKSLWRDAPLSAAPPRPMDVDYVTGCGMLLRRDLLEDVGYFDERFTMYYEDADLCLRARRSGYRIRVVPTARMLHKVSQSARIDRPATGFLWERSRVLFYRNKTAGLQRPLVESFLFLTALRDVVVGLWRGERELVKALIRGFAAGHLPI